MKQSTVSQMETGKLRIPEVGDSEDSEYLRIDAAVLGDVLDDPDLGIAPASRGPYRKLCPTTSVAD